MPLRLDNARALPTCPPQSNSRRRRPSSRDSRLTPRLHRCQKPSSQNASRPGRHQIGRVGEIILESWATSNRYTRARSSESAVKQPNGQQHAFPRQRLPELCKAHPCECRGCRECRVTTSPMARLHTENMRQRPQVRPDQPAFPAQWFYGLSRAPRCTGLCSHRRSQIIACELDPSVGGPHGFAVRIDSARQARQHVHHIPAHVS